MSNPGNKPPAESQAQAGPSSSTPKADAGAGKKEEAGQKLPQLGALEDDDEFEVSVNMKALQIASRDKCPSLSSAAASVATSLPHPPLSNPSVECYEIVLSCDAVKEARR